VSESDFQVLRAGAFVVALVLAVALQRLKPHAGSGGSLRVNASLWLLNAGVVGALCGACACTVARWAVLAGVGALNATAAPFWLALPTTIFALDLVSYGWHRANHVVPALWRFHQVHHSDATFTVSTALRFHPGELVLSLPFRLLAIVALGAPPVAVVLFEGLFTVSNMIEHGDIDLPSNLERRAGRVFITPALHRFHHTRAGFERDHNFGTILVLWDRLLGTYRANTSANRIDVGLPELLAPLGTRAALLLPLTSSRRPTGRTPGPLSSPRRATPRSRS
jgi:sterol desaturase/sphingolipid hydroxylase (fatty acid hydroxylase superfamily)